MNQKNQQNKIGGGLIPLKKDQRDFSLGQVFGRISLETIPMENWRINPPLEIKNQYETDMCAGFAVAAVSEDQEKVILDPFYPFAKTKQIIGEWEGWGVDLRNTCKAAVKSGFIKKEDSPFKLENGRDFLANWNNWPKELDEKAKEHRKKSYFRVDGYYPEVFDSLRAALWQHRRDNRSIITGTLWEDEWTYIENGVIPKTPGNPSFGHAFKIFGQQIINNEIYLVAQLSNGKDIGDSGIFYFPRETVNRKFIYGSFMFKDIDPEDVKKKYWKPCRRFWEKIKKIYSVVWE